MTRQRKRKVREVYETTLQPWHLREKRKPLYAKLDEHYFPLSGAFKLKPHDRVRVTVELLAPRRAKKGSK